MPDDILIDELLIYAADNEYNRILAWAENYNKKLKKGNFDVIQALKGMEILADDVIRGYRKMHGLPRVDREDKEALKQELLDRVMRAIDEGEI